LGFEKKILYIARLGATVGAQNSIRNWREIPVAEACKFLFFGFKIFFSVCYFAHCLVLDKDCGGMILIFFVYSSVLVFQEDTIELLSLDWNFVNFFEKRERYFFLENIALYRYLHNI